MATVPLAENMMDLIDGYCRLEKNTDDTVIYRPNKGMDHVVIEKGAQLDFSMCSSTSLVIITTCLCPRCHLAK